MLRYVTRRTSLVIDDETTLHAVQSALGTSGLKDTVDAAFAFVLSRRPQRLLMDAIDEGLPGLDLDVLSERHGIAHG